MDGIRSFHELSAEQQACAGGKGRVLAWLFQAGYPVPDGLLILPTAFSGDELSPEAWTAVQAHLDRMRRGDPGMAFAVRSSAVSEDSARASFAGGFESVLGVATDEAVRQAIHTVRRSRHSERARAYSEVQSLDQAHEMAVVVQRLVRADVSGVLFTADPVTGSHTRMVGNLVHGLGEQLVSGETSGYQRRLNLLPKCFSGKRVGHGTPYVGLGIAPDYSDGVKVTAQLVNPGGPAEGKLMVGDEILRVSDGARTWETFEELRQPAWGHTCDLYQVGTWDILQRARLREQPGKKLAHHTRKTARTTREAAWISYRGKTARTSSDRG